jgi:hypothetical protein
MTIIDNLKSIVNFSEKEINQPVVIFNYIDFITSDDEEYLREMKQKKRELAIDAILDDKVEEFESYKESNPLMNQPDFLSQEYESRTGVVISPKISQINLKSNRYQSDDDIYKTVISFLDQNTKSQKSTPNGPNKPLDVQLTGDFENDKRRVISKVIMSSNIIAIDGRIGPGTSVICGQNAYKYITNANQPNWVNGETILDITINPDKIIVCRSSRQDQAGLILVKDEKNKNFYFGQTPRWDKQYCWFLIK